jgi:N-methylhydantoinase A/oxoprolinase/acetone carboxylase beta subunit
VVRIGVDTGGTFTDLVRLDGDKVVTHKVRSTPDDPSRAIMTGVTELIAAGELAGADIVHGSTVATNAVLERKGARVALVTTAGFEDVLRIGRQTRRELYNFMVEERRPLVDPALTFGIRERLAADGSVLEALDESAIPPLVAACREQDVDAVAVCLLHAYVNPAHEEAIAAHFERAGFAVSASHRVLPEYREFERFSTTVVNAYVTPLMARYLTALEERLKGDASAPDASAVGADAAGAAVADADSAGVEGAGGAREDGAARDGAAREGLGAGVRLSIMQSNGGSISAARAKQAAVQTILSGPAAGAVGAHAVAVAAGYPRIIGFDMGGTSTDVTLVDGTIGVTTESTVGDFPVRLPIIDIHTVGAGGGSIAYIDAGGALRVGPRSAGADPGPVCYGKGTELTVTDANLLLGRLDASYFLGGRMTLDEARTRAHAKEFAARLGMPETALAEGIVRVANANMERAIRVVSVQRGFDPRDFALLAFGGAGGMHACEIADTLDIATVIAPRYAGVLSALGMLLADVTKDYSLTVLRRAADVTHEELRDRFAPLVARAEEDLAAEGFSGDRALVECALDVRYIGQSYEITVPFEKDYRATFDARHQQTYGYANPRRGAEVVNLRVKAIGVTNKPALPRETAIDAAANATNTARAPEPSSRRTARFGGKGTSMAVYRRDDLRAGMEADGPALIAGPEATTVITPAFRFRVDEAGNIIATRRTVVRAKTDRKREVVPAENV